MEAYDSSVEAWERRYEENHQMEHDEFVAHLPHPTFRSTLEGLAQPEKGERQVGCHYAA